MGSGTSHKVLYQNIRSFNYTINVTHTNGAVAAKFSYTPFGEVLERTIVQSACDIPVGFAGQYGVLQEPNGLYYMNARYYDPSLGRFLSEDPLGLGGGDLTLYSYAGNNPVAFVDPSGLCGQSGGTSSGYADYNLLSVNPVGTGTGALIGGLLTGGNPAGVAVGALIGSMGIYGGTMVGSDNSVYPYLGIAISPSVGPMSEEELVSQTKHLLLDLMLQGQLLRGLGAR